jgi:predicted small metal-binding protein
MSKVLECGSVVPGCRFVIHADNDDELMMKAMAHARAEHGIEHMSEQLKARILAAIRHEKVGGVAPQDA